MFRHNPWQITRAILPRHPPQILKIRSRHRANERIHLRLAIPIRIFIIAVIALFAIVAPYSRFTSYLERPACKCSQVQTPRVMEHIICVPILQLAYPIP